MDKIVLTKKDLDAIITTLAQFPEIEKFEITKHVDSGIGYTIDLRFDSMQNGVMGTFTTEVVGIEDW
jgi:hypothetical protein